MLRIQGICLVTSRERKRMADNDFCYVYLAEATISRAREDYIDAMKNILAFELDTPECLKRRQVAMNRITSAVRHELKKWLMPPTQDERDAMIERRVETYKIVNQRTIINVTTFIERGWIREVVWENADTIINSWNREVRQWAEQ